MSSGRSVLMRVEIGVPLPAARAANAVLARIAPAPRRPVARIPVRWTLAQALRRDAAASAPLSA